MHTIIKQTKVTHLENSGKTALKAECAIPQVRTRKEWDQLASDPNWECNSHVAIMHLDSAPLQQYKEQSFICSMALILNNYPRQRTYLPLIRKVILSLKSQLASLKGCTRGWNLKPTFSFIRTAPAGTAAVTGDNILQIPACPRTLHKLSRVKEEAPVSMYQGMIMLNSSHLLLSCKCDVFVIFQCLQLKAIAKDWFLATSLTRSFTICHIRTLVRFSPSLLQSSDLLEAGSIS